MSFRCPKCSSNTGVYKTERTQGMTVRRHKCPACLVTFATQEQLMRDVLRFYRATAILEAIFNSEVNIGMGITAAEMERFVALVREADEVSDRLERSSLPDRGGRPLSPWNKGKRMAVDDMIDAMKRKETLRPIAELMADREAGVELSPEEKAAVLDHILSEINAEERMRPPIPEG